MGSAPWSFAKTQAQLSASATTPLFDYDYQYAIPSDCLRVLKVEAGKWEVQGTNILCNDAGPINVLYLQQNTDESSWDARFAEALSWRMAIELALALVQSQPMRTLAENSYKDAIAQARAMDSSQNTDKHAVVDLWSGSRRGYGGWMAPVASTPTEYYD